jgi:chromosome segregation and condensation protein ScpB
MDDNEIKYFIEAALLAAGRPMTVDALQNLFDQRSVPAGNHQFAGRLRGSWHYDYRSSVRLPRAG